MDGVVLNISGANAMKAQFFVPGCFSRFSAPSIWLTTLAAPRFRLLCHL